MVPKQKESFEESILGGEKTSTWDIPLGKKYGIGGYRWDRGSLFRVWSLHVYTWLRCQLLYGGSTFYY